MRKIRPFDGAKNWYKGNLHCHSTISDGKLSPEQLVNLYHKNGYAFLAISDHRIFTNLKELNEEDFLMMPAIECNANVPPYKTSYKTYHIHGIQGSEAFQAKAKMEPLKHNRRIENPEWEGYRTVQKMIDYLRDTGNLVVLNHPIWSRLELDDFVELEGFFAMEIFNYNCQSINYTGLNTIYWDSLLRRGKKIWGLASDDNHNMESFNDSCGGWVTVKANELTQNAIADALVKGRFYASSGPEIYEYAVVDGEVFIECSSVQVIHFVTYESRGYSSCWAEEGNTLTKAAYKLKGDEKYIRVECIDVYGKTAWTNPIFL